jgi:hypothetical protein
MRVEATRRALSLTSARIYVESRAELKTLPAAHGDIERPGVLFQLF